MFNFLNNLIKRNSNGKIQFLSCNCPSKYFWILLILPSTIFCLLYILMDKWPNNNKIIFKNILIENTTNYLNKCIEEEENNKKWSLQCCGEQMSISFNVETNNKLTENTISGKRFDCKHLQILQKYKLADKYKIEQKIQVKKPNSKGFVIVTAATDDFWPTLRKLFYVVKKQFGCSQKIIAYDLGSISEDKNNMEEINSVCNLEWRKYNWSIMPNNVHSPKAYAWKLYIIAEVYSQYDTFMWADTAFTIEDVKSLDPIFESIESGNISETVIPGYTGHTIQQATDLRTFTYLPLITEWIQIKNNTWDKDMLEDSIIIFHKSEFTRNVLKWALLCAATKECIEPDDAELNCEDESMDWESSKGTCHRRDQSVFAIIVVNFEYLRSLKGKKLNNLTFYLNLEKQFIPHNHPDHPRKYSKHDIRRREELDDNVNFKKEVACCKN